jgi:hypothetical protein
MSKRSSGSSRPSILNVNREYRRHKVRSSPRLEQLEQRVALSTFQVNTTLDTVAVDLHTGRDASGHVSLRSAIMAANAQGGSNTINLPSATDRYKLTIAGGYEDAGATGDLDITSNLTINGAGASSTVIDGNNLDRVFHVLGGAKVNISGVTIENGRANEGGGLLNAGGQVKLSSVVVTGNLAIGARGARGPNSRDVQGGNGGTGLPAGIASVGQGGGISNSAGSLVIMNSTISGNQAIGGDGAQGGAGGSASGIDQSAGPGQSVTGGPGGYASNGSYGKGGGIYNGPGASLTLSGTRITANVAQGGNGGQGGKWFRHWEYGSRCHQLQSAE